MTKSVWSINLLSSKHNRANFDCGEIILNDYLQKLAGQHSKTNISRSFVAISLDNPDKVMGFYTLSAGSLAFDNLPQKFKKLPKYPIPIIRIGHLAVDKSMQGQGIGEYLLMNALHRSASHCEEIGAVGVVVDAKHETAKNFYLKYGFCELNNSPLTLIIPMQDIIATVK